MSTSKAVKNDYNWTNSGTIQAFPASRRNVQYYGSRIMSEDNAKRALVASIKLSADEQVGGGTFILSHKAITEGDDKTTKDIEFFIKGYYFRLHDENSNCNDTCPPLQAIRNAIGTEGGTIYLYIYVYPVVPDSSSNVGAKFIELDCKDESGEFIGLFRSTTRPPGDCYGMIPIVVPQDGTSGPGILNPALDVDSIYKPWFQSSASFAASEFSDKNKIWVDNVYDVPHICVQVGDKRKWIPLGAVYKTSQNSRT